MGEPDVFPVNSPNASPEQTASPSREEPQLWQHPTALTVWKNLFSLIFVLAAVFWGVLQNAIRDEHAEEVWGWVVGLGLLAVLVVTAGVLVVALVTTAWAYVVWRHTRFAFLEDGIHISSGILVKRREQVRWERIQTVEITQDFIAQVFRQGTLVIENLGSDPSMKIGLLPNAELELLRVQILAFAARARAGEPITHHDCLTLLRNRQEVRTHGNARPSAKGTEPSAAQPDVSGKPDVNVAASSDTPLFVQSLWQSCVAAFLDAGAIIPAVAAVVGFLIFDLGEGFGVFVAGAFVAAAITGIAQRVNAVWNLRVLPAEGGGLRVRVGGAGTSARMLLPGRITTVRITQPLLYRPLKLWRLDVYTLAGLSDAVENAGNRKTNHVIPAGGYEQVRKVALYILQAMELTSDPARSESVNECEGADSNENVLTSAGEQSHIGANDNALQLNPQMYDVLVRGDHAASEQYTMPQATILSEAGLELGCFYRASRRARWLSPCAYKREGVVLFSQCMATRGGWLRRNASLARLERLQSVKMHAGPFDRALGVASVMAAFTATDSNVRFAHGDQAVAEAVARSITALATALQREESAKH